MRVFGISDIHTDHKENWARLAELPVGPYLGDVLLVAGDVSHDMRTFSRTMHMLRERFALVFFVPGNHDVWVGDSDVEKFEDRGVSGTTTRLDSLGKHRWLLEECARLGVWTTPAHFPQEELVIVPLLSWYHEEFDTEPDVPDHAWSSAAARRQRRMAMLSDEIGCEWPAHLGTGAPRNYALAELLDAANDEGPEEDAAPLTASVAAEPVSFREAKAARERGASVISFSHFLPRPELLPEKRFLFFPQLAKAAGSLPLRTRVADLRPTLHLFGHTHFAWDQRLSCARYVQAPLGTPRERHSRPRTLHLDGGVPALLWRGRRARVPVPAPRSALWSAYYESHERRPESAEVGAWLKLSRNPRAGRRKGALESQAGGLLGEASEPAPAAPGRTAVLWLVWDLDREPGALQESLLSPDERARAAAFQGAGARNRFVWMRAALRCVLGEVLHAPPQELSFVYGAHGKPELRAPAAARRCSFSVTHSGDVGAILLSAAPWHADLASLPVGVDLERHRDRPFSALARRFFTQAEQDALARAAEADAGMDGAESSEATAFFEMWTKKEAWLKALGVGIGGGLRSLDCGDAGDAAATFEDGATGERHLYTICSMRGLPLDGYSAAVAVPRGAPLRLESLSAVGWPHLLRRARKPPGAPGVRPGASGSSPR